MIKFIKQHDLIWWVFVASVVVVGLFFGFRSVARHGNQQIAAAKATRLEWTQQMLAANCNVTSFVATKSYITEVWKCPNNPNLILGYSQ